MGLLCFSPLVNSVKFYPNSPSGYRPLETAYAKVTAISCACISWIRMLPMMGTCSLILTSIKPFESTLRISFRPRNQRDAQLLPGLTA
ncbi:hypothetical protein CDAR_248661 [Caerostris darwini]|uniref:Uncharacterized protein n=1 Tax=Caerostris darwini TaxID=1538125 RepID=A0AAV4MRI9_9ARAC|nr:hypothetical protein CDAR_248661 [Caerostris darwini]